MCMCKIVFAQCIFKYNSYAILCSCNHCMHIYLGADPTVENNRGLSPSNYTTNEAILSMMTEYATKVHLCVLYVGGAAFV